VAAALDAASVRAFQAKAEAFGLRKENWTAGPWKTDGGENLKFKSSKRNKNSLSVFFKGFSHQIMLRSLA